MSSAASRASTSKPLGVRSAREISSETLDAFKALAALAMVVNHAGFAWLSPQAAVQGASGLLVFLGSMAPALFFFATGVGAGFKPASSPVQWPHLLRKVGWLVLADLFLVWSEGQAWGFDFFGFIALCTLVVSWVGHRRHWARWCGILSLLLLLLRFGLRPQWVDPSGFWPVALWVTGIEGQTGISYPLSPWLMAALAGMCLGRMTQTVPSTPARAVLSWVLTVGCACTAVVLYQRGANFFRWGSVSAAFMLAAVGCIAGAWLMARGMVAWRAPAISWLSLRGSSALMIVPLHYAILALVGACGVRQNVDEIPAIVLMLLLALATVWISRRWTSPWCGLFKNLGDGWLLGGLALLAAILWAPGLPTPVRILCSCLAQALIATRFGSR